MASEYGLLIEVVNHYGSEYLEARIVRRENGGDSPLGCSGDGESFYSDCPKHLVGLTLDGLGIYGFVSDYGEPAFIGTDVEYRNVYSSSEHKLARMLKTIKRVNARISKDEAREPGDKIASLAAALKLDFVVERVGKRAYGGGGFNDSKWRWMSVAEGRNRYRAMVGELVAAATVRKKEIA